MMKIRKWFSLNEVIAYVNNIMGYAVPTTRRDKNMASNWFTKLIDDMNIAKWDYTPVGTINVQNSDLFINFLALEIVNRYWNDYCIKIEGNFPSIDIPLTSGEVREFFVELVNQIELTLPRYLPLMTQFSIGASDPVPQLKSTTRGSNRFNDTPQNVSSDFYNDDNHATNVSASVSELEADAGSLMSRLEEMYRDFHNILQDWSNEFYTLFVKEEQIVC